MTFSNRFTQLNRQLATLPADARQQALTTTMQRLIPILGTLGIVVDQYESTVCRLRLPNHAGVQNGWGGLQAGGMYTTAESAMAFVVGANLPDNRLVVAKSVTIDYVRKAQGGISVTATLTDEQAQQLQQTGMPGHEKGQLTLHCTVVDETGAEVCRCQAVWVWLPV